MNGIDYQRLALRTMADQGRILERLADLGPKAMQLDNGARGLANDAGEVCSAVMKYVEYGRELDRTNVIEECGDVLWRVAQVLDAVGSTVDEAMIANVRKLEVRYPERYSDVSSANRDKLAELKAIAESVVSYNPTNAPTRPGESDPDLKETKVSQDGHGFGHPEQRCKLCGSFHPEYALCPPSTEQR